MKTRHVRVTFDAVLTLDKETDTIPLDGGLLFNALMDALAEHARKAKKGVVGLEPAAKFGISLYPSAVLKKRIAEVRSRR